MVAAVADGVSSASESQWGAFAACSRVLHVVQDRLLDGGMDDIDWSGVLDEVRRTMEGWLSQFLGVEEKERNRIPPKRDAGRPCWWHRRMRKAGERKPPRHDVTGRETELADVVGTTCEALVVELHPDDDHGGPLRFVRATLAGDGSAYLFDRTRGILSLGTTKAISRGTIDNAVHPLPSMPGPAYPIVRRGEIGRGQMLLLTTDGVGDDMSVDEVNVADSDVAAYLWHRLIRPVPGHELLRIMGYVCGTSFDDRSAVIVWA